MDKVVLRFVVYWKLAAQQHEQIKVRSFIGMVGFSARFIPNFATIAELKELKLKLVSETFLAYFDKDAHTRVVADANAVGIWAVLVQEKNGESRVICYASQSLSSVERRYSQTEKEGHASGSTCTF